MSEDKEKQKTLSMLVIEIPHHSTENNHTNDHHVTIGRDLCDKKQSTNCSLFRRSIVSIFNLSLLIAITSYYILEVTRQLRDPLYHDSIFNGICWSTIIQLFDITLTLDLTMSAIILLIVFPLCRVKRSTFFYISLSMVCSSVIFALMFILAKQMTIAARIITVLDVTRLCMKMISFIVECKRNDQVSSTFTISSLRYYLFIPDLIYKTQYVRYVSIKWLQVLSHLWWIWVAMFPFMSLMSGLFNRLTRFDITTTDVTSLTVNVFTLMTTSLTTVAIVCYFFLHRNLFALQAQLSRVSNDIGLKRWFIEYIHSPVMGKSKSLYRANVLTIICLLFIIESCTVYTFQVYIVLDTLIMVTLILLLLLTIHRHHLITCTVVAMIVSFNLFTYLMDLVVVNYTSHVSVNTFDVRFIPLSMRMLLQQHCNITSGILEWL